MRYKIAIYENYPYLWTQVCFGDQHEERTILLFLFSIICFPILSFQHNTQLELRFSMQNYVVENIFVYLWRTPKRLCFKRAYLSSHFWSILCLKLISFKLFLIPSCGFVVIERMACHRSPTESWVGALCDSQTRATHHAL